MTDVTTVGEIVVKGRRRVREGDPFPSRPVYEPYQPDVSGIDPVPEEQPPDPCADPETALDWNADAAGAQSISPFLSKAAELGDVNPQTGQVSLSNRELGRALGRGPGSTVFGNAVRLRPH
ncbi:hypothetical protein [Brevundimonas balnearis]|uniref:Uncharacterized protein n=1 Tax=Brevundimonas balnearis TaxID=1572858 RepID=A0ABV6R6R4_9CAUL